MYGHSALAIARTWRCPDTVAADRDVEEQEPSLFETIPLNGQIRPDQLPILSDIAPRRVDVTTVWFGSFDGLATNRQSGRTVGAHLQIGSLTNLLGNDSGDWLGRIGNREFDQHREQREANRVELAAKPPGTGGYRETPFPNNIKGTI